jgi:ribosome biogenesis GTPase
MQENLRKALVVRVTGGEVWVETEDGGMVSCVLRGRLRRKEPDLKVAAGDFVGVLPPKRESETWSIEELRPRSSRLSRYVERDATERIIVANVERLYVVASLRAPRVHYEFVDRVLVSAEWGGVSASVILNKVDLIEAGEGRRFDSLYRSCGYPVRHTSVVTGEGVERLKDEMGTGVYAFVGASGVGKTSLLMSIDPDLDLKVGEIGDKTGRGRHTTTFSQLYRFGRGYLADTPGIQTFGYPGSDWTELADCFPEFERFSEACRFYPCAHSHEPDCGVKQALEDGAIQPSRYASYLNTLSEVEARAKRSGQ